MKDLPAGPALSKQERFEEGRRFGSYLFCAIACSSFTAITGSILYFRKDIIFDSHILAAGSVAAGIFGMVFGYFGAIRKHMIVIPILRIWTITFLTLQVLVFLIAVPVYLNYGVHNPAMAAVDSALAAGLSLMGLAFGLFGLIRGIRHNWFAHVLSPDFTRD